MTRPRLAEGGQAAEEAQDAQGPEGPGHACRLVGDHHRQQRQAHLR